MTESRWARCGASSPAPCRRATVVVGKALFTAVLSLISLVILAAIGWSLASTDRRPSRLPPAVLRADPGHHRLLARWSTARRSTLRQGATISGVLMLVFAFLGGAFIQLNSMSRRHARASPRSLPSTGAPPAYQKLLNPAAASGRHPAERRRARGAGRRCCWPPARVCCNASCAGGAV